MQSPIETASKPLGAYLVGVRRDNMTALEAEEHLGELELLTETYGVPVVGREMVVLREAHATYLVGSGKAKEIKERAEVAGAEVVILDDDLTPGQQRNWEKLTEKAVIDRQEVILGIFADRARTREARLQVELARAEYSLPRLKRAWTHLERQRGGGAFKGGAGEAQLEIDRRLVKNQIEKLKRELEHVRQVRATQRVRRVGIPIPNAALVGYTNAGKSSLMNALTGAGVLAVDKLFATLDPTTRQFELPNGQKLLLTDTVGFIRKLPHTLVESFQATLEESKLADFVVHVLDANHPSALEHRQATEAVLEELGVRDKPTILVLNKVDLVDDRATLVPLRAGYDVVVETSAVTREGLSRLAQTFVDFVGKGRHWVELRVPAARGDVLALLHREGHVESLRYEDEVAVIEAELPHRYLGRVAEFLARESPTPESAAV